MAARSTLALVPAAVCAALTALAAPAAAAAKPCPNGAVVTEELSIKSVERSLTCLVNQRRAASRRGVVRRQRLLRRAAARQSRAMVRRGFFDHTWPTGLTFDRRIRQSGYAKGSQSWCAGENLVWARGSRSTARRLVRAWMRSPSHRRNLLDPRYSQIGVAAVRGTPSRSNDRAGITATTTYGNRSC